MTLTVYNDSFPPEGFCQFVSFSLYPAFNYRQNPSDRLSSEVFNKNPPNEYSVLLEYTIIVVGQIVTSGIEVTWDSETSPLPADQDPPSGNPLTLCIPLEGYIEEDAYFEEYELGTIKYSENGTGVMISRIFPGGIKARIVNGSLCGNITEPGNYIGIKVVTDADYRYHSLLGQGIAGSVIYWLLLACM